MSASTYPEDRSVRLKFEGPAVQNGKVPLLIVAEKLIHLQKSLFSIAASSLPKHGKRGDWSAKVKRSCELRFAETHHSSLEIVSELPPAEEFEAVGFDLGITSLHKLREVLTSIGSRNTENVVALFPDAAKRARILKSIVGVFPNEDDDYNVVIGMDSRPACFVLRAEDREFINEATVEETDVIDEESVRNITGKLFRIEIDTAERHVAIESMGRRIRCRYPDYLEDTISQFVAGSLVEVRGKATFDSSGNVQEIKEILGIDEVEMGPVLMKRVRENGRSLVFNDSISVSLDYQDGLWVYTYDPLGVLAYAETRREAMKNMREEFFVLWDEIRNCPDTDLTLDAQELKARLNELMKEED